MSGPAAPPEAAVRRPFFLPSPSAPAAAAGTRRLATSLALATLLLLPGCQDTPPRDPLVSPGETVAYVTEDGRIYLGGFLVAEPGDRALRAFATEVTRLHRDSLRKGRKFEILLRVERRGGLQRCHEALDALAAGGGPGKIPVCLEVLDP